MLIGCFYLSPIYAEGEETPSEEEETQEPTYVGPEVDAPSAILIDTVSGTILASKEIEAPHNPAGITKMMSVLLALEEIDMSQGITMSSEAFQTYDHSSGVIWVMEGETIPAIDLAYASMIQNANDTTAMLAEAVSGNQEAFVAKMNETAKEYGMEQTSFENIFGLPGGGQTSTAQDIAVLTRRALRNETFQTIFGTAGYRIAPTAYQPNERILSQNCEMLRSGDMYYEEAQGCKIAYSSNDGYSLTVEAKRNGMSLIAVVLGGTTEYGCYMDARKLFDYGFSQYQSIEITPEQIGTKTIEVMEGKNHTADVIFSVEKGFSALLPTSVDRSTLNFEIVTKNETSDNPEIIDAEVVFTLDGKEVGRALMKKEIQYIDTTSAITRNGINIRDIFDYICIGVLGLLLLRPIFQFLAPPQKRVE